MTESAVTKLIRLSLQPLRVILFRNNSGAFKNPKTGAFVRYGLGVGSSDLIGWTEHIITEADVGRPVAIFTAIEMKSAKGKTTKEQDNFIARVQLAGGIATVAKTESEAVNAVTKWKKNE